MNKEKGIGIKEVLGLEGCSKREFLFSEDMAEACVLLMKKCRAVELGGIVNIGCGKDITIDELAHLIAEVVGYKGAFIYDKTKPDGTPQKLLDITKITKLGWAPRTALREGIQKTYEWYCQNVEVP
jgi:GDP-L-fucose synthase